MNPLLIIIGVISDPIGIKLGTRSQCSEDYGNLSPSEINHLVDSAAGLLQTTLDSNALTQKKIILCNKED